jgi:methionyl-tRNA synthetase
MDKSRERDALLKANEISSVGNKYLQDLAPWTLAKTDLIGAGTIIANCIDLFKLLSLVYSPFIPNASKKISELISFNLSAGFLNVFDEVKTGTEIKPIGILFQKLEHKQVEEFKQKFSGIKK